MGVYTKLLFHLFYTFYVLVIARKRGMLRHAHLRMHVLQRCIAWEANYQRLARRLMRESNECIIFLMQTESDLGLDEEGQRFFLRMQQRYEVSPGIFKNLNR